MKLTISEMYAFVAEDGEGEGVVAFLAPDGTWMPMVAADAARVDSLRPIAQAMGKSQNITIKLVRFDNRTEMETYEPAH